MSDSSYNKMDFIIIIVISLLVAFIIGFNIIQVIDNKLGAVTINVPPNNCNIPPIYLNIDKDSNIKQIKLNDFVQDKSNYEQMLNDEIDSRSIEHFGNISPIPDTYSSEVYEPRSQTVSHIISGLTSTNTADKLISQPSLYDTAQDPNFNNLNNIPVLISPDPPGPNSVPASSPSYYNNRVKLIDNPDSDLLKLYQKNHNKLEQKASSCNAKSRAAPPLVNGTFDGYNAFENLNVDSYANVTAIGKSMLTPYTSFPVPS
jgi:hypothetical protein